MQQLSAFLKPRSDMDNPELIRWALSLGATHDERIKCLEDMLLHAKEDQMLDEDQSLVRGVLDVVREQSYREPQKGVKKVVAPHPAQPDEEADDWRFV